MSSSSKPGTAELTETIIRLLADGEASVVETDGKIIRRIKPTKIGQINNKCDIINSINTFLKENNFMEERTKRIYRRKSDLPNPDLSPQSEDNLSSSKLTPRVSREHVELFNACAKQFSNKREALERAVELLAQESGVQPDFHR